MYLVKKLIVNGIGGYMSLGHKMFKAESDTQAFLKEQRESDGKLDTKSGVHFIYEVTKIKDDYLFDQADMSDINTSLRRLESPERRWSLDELENNNDQ